MSTLALRHVARMSYGDALATETRAEGDIPVMSSGGVTGTHDRANTTAPCIVIGRKGSHGSVHWSDDAAFVIDTAYWIDERSTDLHLRWVYYLLAALDLKAASQDVGVPGLAREAAYDLRVPTPPPLHEQRQIADFLDEQVGRIELALTLEHRATELSLERLDAVREEALVQSVDASWTPLQQLVEDSRPISYGIVQAGPDVPDGIPYIKTGDMLNFDPKLLSRTSPDIEAAYRRSRVRPGDLVIAMRASIGALIEVPETLPIANLTQGTARIAPKPTVDRVWLHQALLTRFVQEQFQQRAVGSTFRTLNLWDLRRVPIPVPQRADAASVGRQVLQEQERTQQLIALRQAKVRLMEERKQALITAAVTGQLDVTTARAVA
jgi:type I restriction enzyme S subunit